jgi:transposase-like protein
MEYPTTLVDAVKYFSNEQVCIDEVASMRWPDGQPFCIGCGEVGKLIWLANQKRFKCRSCKKQFSVKVGTIFHDSPLGLDKWMVAMWMLANCRNGVSSYEIARTIGITQKSAWHMLHRIRKAMTDLSGNKLGGAGTPVEIDETFVGGKMKNMHKSRRDRSLCYGGGNGKAIVMGMLERGGKVRASVIESRHARVMQPPLVANVEAGANIITDEFTTYPFLAKDTYVHEIINHVEGYVRDHVHTNGIENFWSCLKRGLNGTYISVEPFHLDRYVDEQVFRFNLRHKHTDAARFKAVLKDIVGRRLTYAELTGRTA